MIPTTPPVIQCKESEFFDGQRCQCLPGHIRNAQGVCVISIVCGDGSTLTNGVCVCNIANSVYSGDKCVCNAGFIRQGNQCVVENCPPNSFSNGVGECICNAGFVKVNGVCVERSCPQNSKPVSGQCVCIDGFTKINGVCQQCQDGFILLNGICVKICGQNEEVCPNKNDECCCLSGFGIKENKCQLCNGNEFLLGQFCV